MSPANRRGNDLKHSLPSICRALTRQKGIKLVFRGPPRTDGKTIYSNPMPVQANDDEVMVITGDIDHECGHVLYSDFSVLETLQKTVPKSRFPLVKHVHNALEDTFIERRLGEAYLGCRETLARSTEIMERDGKIHIVGTDQPSMALTQYIDAWGRVNVLKQKLDQTLSGCSKVLPQLIGEDGVSKLNEILSTRLPGVKSSSDTMSIALDIEKLIEDTQQEREEQPDASSQSQQSSDSDDQTSGDDDENSSSGHSKSDDKDKDSSGASNEGEDESGKTAQNQDDNQAQGQNQGESQGEASGQGQNPESQPEDSDTQDQSGNQNGDAHERPEANRGPRQGQGQNEDQGEGESQGPGDSQSGNQPGSQSIETGTPTAAAQGARAIIEDQGEYTPLVDRSPAAEEAIEAASARSMRAGGEGGILEFKPNLDEYKFLHDSTASGISELQRRLVMEYQTRTRRRSVISEQGRLDGHRLPRAFLGDPMIYRQRVKRVMPYPTVSLVMDCSSSMRGQPIILAKQAMIAVAEANRQLGVKTEIVAFAGVDTRIVKPFDVDLNAKSQAEIGGVIAEGGTPTAEALWLAGNRLVARRESRKLLLLVTDGLPNDLEHAIEVAGMIERSGIEIYGIGIRCDAIKAFTSKSTVIHHASSIAEAVVTAIRTRLLNAA